MLDKFPLFLLKLNHKMCLLCAPQAQVEFLEL